MAMKQRTGIALSDDQKCVHLAPNSGQTSVNFDIHLGKCGMSSSDASPAHQNQLQQQQTSQSSQLQQQQQQQQPNGVFIENTIIIQYDPLVQEIYDQARKLRCTWYDYYEKSVTFRPYNVDMLDAVTANFLGDNIQCWMQIQVGKGPWSSEVAGIVKIGQTMTMVLAIKDDENRFDMLVRNCVAHDGKHAPIQLVDEYGCVARPKIMSRFQKVRNFGPAATVVSYAHFQAFKFPDSMSVHFQCVIQVCRYECPEPVCNGAAGELGTGAAGSLATLSSGTPTNAQGQPPASDYAASGTEIMPAKEPLPAGFQAHGQASYAQSPGALAGNQSHQVHQLRLDDSQGRVQVRLDTSMMAAMRPSASSSAAGPLPPHAGAPRQQLAPGPLPPHLLHMAPPGEQPATAHLQRPAHSPLYRPAPSQVASQVANRRPPAGHHLAPLASAAPPAGAHQHQFSMPYPQQAAARRSSAASAASLLQFGHRMGDQGQSLEQQQSQQQQSQQQQPQHTLAAPYETEQHPLSLIAAPRGLASGSPTAELDEQLAGARLRLKRSPTNGTSAAPEVAAEKSQPASQLGSQSTGQPGGQKTRRQAPSASGPGASSTSVQTQRTIQVVSPDDVAFSLMEPLEEQWPSESAQSPTGSWTSRRRPLNSGSADAASSVCFSTGRFLWVALVTVGALASGIVAVGVVILRQKAQLEQKLSAVYDHTQLAGCAPQAQPGHQRDSQLLFRRQQEELQQRHNYLARLYSQFTPASYWR